MASKTNGKGAGNAGKGGRIVTTSSGYKYVVPNGKTELPLSASRKYKPAASVNPKDPPRE